MTQVENHVPFYQARNWPDADGLARKIFNLMLPELRIALFDDRGLTRSNKNWAANRARFGLSADIQADIESVVRQRLSIGRMYDWAFLKELPGLERAQAQYLLDHRRLVPANVLRRHPNLSLPRPVPWDVDRAEWLALVQSGTFSSEDDHREYVAVALEFGLPVPSLVLLAYPDLVAQYGLSPC